MKKPVAVLVLVLVGASLQAQLSTNHPDYDPFANATGSGGTSYTVGANLAGPSGTTTNLTGQINAQGLPWYAAGNGVGGQPVISAGNLNIPGLLAETGNSITYAGNSGITARWDLGTSTASSPISPTNVNLTVYYSMAFKVNSLGSLTTAPAFVAGFNNSAGPQTAQPTIVGARLYTRLATPGYNLGINKADGTAGDISWEPATYAVGATVFVVGAYTFSGNPAVPNDSVSLWVNPNSATFGAPSAPTADFTTSAGANMAANANDQIASFLIREASTAEPGSMTVDALRIGLTWADVTPPATVAPTVNCAGNTQTVNNTPPSCTASVSFAASATGTPPPSITYTIPGPTTITSPYNFPVGTTTVTATATNSAGTNTCTFTVTVNDTTTATPGAFGMGPVEGIAESVPLAKILTRDTISAGTLSICGATSPTPNGGTVSVGGGVLIYTSAANLNPDTITYQLCDQCGTQIGTGTIDVTVSPNSTGNNELSATTVGPNVQIHAFGIPGQSYYVQVAPTLTGPWTDEPGTPVAADSNGNINYTVTSPTSPSYYRTSTTP